MFAPRELNIRRLIEANILPIMEHGMSTAAKVVDPRVMTIEVTDDEIVAHLVDGRTIIVPLVWSWRLTDATWEQRQHWEILGDGEGVRWPDINEDISVEGMLYGMPAHRRRGYARVRK